MLKVEEMLFHLRQDEVWWYAGSTRLDCCSSLWLKVVEVKNGARCDSLEGPSDSLFNSYILWWWRSLGSTTHVPAGWPIWGVAPAPDSV